jgi:hypothetical protein
MNWRKIAGILMCIFGSWLFFIPIYVGIQVYRDKEIFGLVGERKKTSDILKLVFAFVSCIIPGILLLMLSKHWI